MSDDGTRLAPFRLLSAQARTRLREQPEPEWIDPTLATLVHEPFNDPGWLFEPKFDGERCLIFKHGQRVQILSRNRKQLGGTYPELVQAVADQASLDCILDGEIVAFDGANTSFARLQQRLQLQNPGSARRASVPVYCYLFDITHLGDYDLTTLALRERKKLLMRVVDFADPLRLTPYQNEHGISYYQRACRAGQEGALAKDATSGYVQGRSRTWLKFKCVVDQELVIGGYTDPAGSRPGLGALLVGYYQRGRLIYAGKVGTGFDERTLRDLRQRLSSLARDQSPFAENTGARAAHWVEPALVADIAFTEWTQDGKLRHPSYLGLRRDKNPADVVREHPR